MEEFLRDITGLHLSRKMDQDGSNVDPEKEDTFNSQTAERTLEMHLYCVGNGRN
jgi:hypothetical protein